MYKVNNKPNWKNITNKIAIITAIIFAVSALLEYIIQNYDLMQILAYATGFSFLVWFATRRNGCGSCNQDA